MLVRRDVAGQLQPVDGKLLRGRGVEDHRHAETVAQAHGGLDGFQRDLHLHQHRVGAFDQRTGGFDLGGPDAAVGGGHHDDLVFAVGDGDRGGAAGAVVEAGDVGEVDVFGGEARVQLVAEGVATERADQRYFRAQSRGGHGLVGALAAGHGEEAFAQDGFARADEARRLGDQVHVDAADDDDACHASSPPCAGFTVEGRA